MGTKYVGNYVAKKVQSGLPPILPYPVMSFLILSYLILSSLRASAVW